MRFAVISDVHGNLPALRRVVAHIATQGVDGVVDLGDCVSAPLWPRETLELLAALGAVTVRGNHDRWLGDPARVASQPTVAFTAGELGDDVCHRLAALPASATIAASILAVHGTPASDEQYLLEESVDDRLRLVPAAALGERLTGTASEVVLCGHSHLQHVAWAPGRRLVVNPGSVGAPRYAGNADPAKNEAGSPHARYAAITRGRHGWSVEAFALDYDWDAVVRRAIEVGRADWAAAFARDG